MAHFIAGMERMRVQVESPSGLLSCGYSLQNGHRFQLESGDLSGHNTESLETEVIDLIKAVRVQYSMNLSEIKESRPGRTAESRTAGGPSSHVDDWLRRDWLRRYRTALEELEVHVEGPRSIAGVWLFGDGDIDVSLDVDVSKGTSEVAKALDDLSSALNDAADRLWRANIELRRSIDDDIRDVIQGMTK